MILLLIGLVVLIAFPVAAVFEKTIQDCRGGLMGIQKHNNADARAVYVLFDNFQHYTRSGEATGRVWFRIS